MRCIFCKKPVFGSAGISLLGRGLSHRICFEMDEAQRRTFKGLDITALHDQELTDLKDLVLSEENSRNGEGDDIELF